MQLQQLRGQRDQKDSDASTPPHLHTSTPLLLLPLRHLLLARTRQRLLQWAGLLLQGARRTLSCGHGQGNPGTRWRGAPDDLCPRVCVVVFLCLRTSAAVILCPCTSVPLRSWPLACAYILIMHYCAPDLYRPAHLCDPGTVSLPRATLSSVSLTM